jgi:sigma-B regulation protein RsbU (phosphoserine phosphatase)
MERSMSRIAPPIPIPRPPGEVDPCSDADIFRLSFGHLFDPPAHPSHQQLEALRTELELLKGELNILRRRDATLNFYMSRLDEELRLAARLQQDFLPRTLPQLGRVHFHTLFRPAGYVSGDLYDVMRLDETHLGFFIVDAVGHGMPAALLTMFIKRALQTKEIFPGGYRLLEPEQTISRLNDALVEQDLSAATFATGLYGIIDTVSLDVTLCAGGHPPPLLLRDGDFTVTQAQGSLLGVFPGERYTSSSIRLRAGDRLVIYSDGVEVAFHADQGSDFEQWKREILSRATLPTEGLLIDFADVMDRECGSLQPKDDLTMIVLEIK